jgi:hypothetical protein
LETSNFIIKKSTKVSSKFRSYLFLIHWKQCRWIEPGDATRGDLEVKGEGAVGSLGRDCKHKGLPKFAPSEVGNELLMLICIDLIVRLQGVGGGEVCD